ncbi:hypothetical protein [Hydrogenophaga sp. SL48]|jgi:hypothetical protein|uniref:hypothetical protein n=1 Tax=Hydrogenophaga sp. SL48 TaxID=2806347 RepID=UPI001F161C5D|nr:hypothetical protein [Hydrogenophaga sp. SL48]UJW79902.1 hypothetical protein IM738_18805 [Hydrogenophaga sp. SL48]
MPYIPRSSLALALVLVTGGAHAQSTPAPAAPASASAPAPSSPAKKELVQRVLKLQQSGIERLATAMTEEPAVVLVERASMMIAANVPKERQEAISKEIQADVQKYLKDTVPQVRKSAQQLAPSTIGAVLESKFSEEELRQVVAVMESPAYAKYQQLSGEMQQTLQAKLVDDTRATVEPRVQALEKTLGDRLRVATQASAPATKPAAPAKPAK